MRRAAVIGTMIVAAAVVVLAISSSGGSSYRVAALFDTAKGLVGGQQVRIAGAVVGSVQTVDLAPGPKARVVMNVEQRFAPFRQDATCTILPEGLISENYVQCNPGRAAASLAGAPGQLPTIPLARTTVPLSLQDVVNVLSLPTDQRLGVLVSELGIGLSGRGQDLNQLLRRANPALTQSRQVLSILDSQRTQIAAAVGQTDQVLGSLAAQGGQVRGFIDRAATVAQATAQHRVPLAADVQRLPAMLAAVRPGLRSLDRAATNATPLLVSLRASAPGLQQLTTTLPAFAQAGTPAVRTLAAAAATGRPAVLGALPVVSRLRAVSDPLATLAGGLSRLLVSSRDSGAIEGVLKVAYAFANNTSLYDSVSHILVFIVQVAPGCIAGQQGGFDVAGCAHNYQAPGQGALPVNEPSCGPKNPAWFNERCPLAIPGPISLAPRPTSPAGRAALGRLNGLIGTALAGRTPDRAALRPLLDYLLK
jgi:virulence factor Mce-like protein